MKKHKAFYMQVEKQKTVTYVNETKKKRKEKWEYIVKNDKK